MKVKKILKFLLISSGILLVTIICIIKLLSILGNFGVDNYIIDEVYSPDDKYKAVIFDRDTGATTDFNTQISIISSKSSLPNDPGNLFIADTNHGRAPSGKGGGPEVTISWISSTEIIITYHRKARIFKQEGSIKSIQAKYTYLP